MEEIEIDDVLIYRGDIYELEKDRNQIITFIDVDGSLFTKFIDGDEMNIVNPKSGYFYFCDIIPKEKHKLKLTNGIPINWDDEN
jgi:ssDNA-binding Zn-finger/Zn-ribbon topoisomerase 1